MYSAMSFRIQVHKNSLKYRSLKASNGTEDVCVCVCGACTLTGSNRACQQAVYFNVTY